MTNEIPNRYRVSTKFTIVRIIVYIGILSIVFQLIKEIRNDSLTQKSIIGLSLGTIALSWLLYFISTRKRIDYDDIKQILYIVDEKKHTEIEIPVEKIDKILISSIGFGRSNYSYLIIYRDVDEQNQKVRLFPIPFDNSIDTIMADTKLKNPQLVTRSWSIGYNL